jgi:hypothetical protein
MAQVNYLDNLQYFFGRGIHLHQKSIVYRGWSIIPIFWRERQIYTIGCFCPRGRRYIKWYQYRSIEEAIFAGKTFVKKQS